MHLTCPWLRLTDWLFIAKHFCKLLMMVDLVSSLARSRVDQLIVAPVTREQTKFLP